MIQIGIIGAGGIVRQRHLPGLAAIPGVRVAAVCNRSHASGEAVAREWGIPEVVDDWRELVKRPDLDAILIGTWPYTHAEMSEVTLRAGKHVFCQARMARTAEEARAMRDVARAHPHQVAMLCPPPAGMLGDRVMRRLLREGFLGELREVHAEGLSAANIDPEAPLHWRHEFALQGFNTLTLGMWIEVIERWVGPHAGLSALTKTHVPRRRDPVSGEMREVRVAESVAIAAELRTGAVGSYRFSGVAHLAPPNRISLYGSQGTLHYCLDTDRITGGSLADKVARQIPLSGDEARPWSVEADWIDAMTNGKPVEPSFEDGWRYMEFTEAVYTSAAERRWVELPA